MDTYATVAWKPQGDWKRTAVWAIRWLVLICIVVVAFDWGLKARRWTYEHTDAIRHRYDIRNNLLYGQRAIDEGVLNLYNNVRAQRPHGQYGLDYVPLRLLTMRTWAVIVREQFGRNIRFQPQFEFARPLLYFNTGLEALSALAVFLLIRHWVRKSDEVTFGTPPHPWRGVVRGLAGAMLLWFSPAVMVSAHGWPSWDIWVVPFFLWSVLLGCWNRWFLAGVVLGVGTMFKGQQLMIVALFLLWPLFMGRPGAMGRWAAGYIFAAGMIVAPWLLRNELTRQIEMGALLLVASAVAASVLLAIKPLVSKWKWSWVVLAILWIALLSWPWMGERSKAQYATGALFVFGSLPLALFLRPQHHPVLVAGLVGTAIALCPTLFGSDLSWWDVSFRYGSEKFAGLYQFSANTLPSLLQARFGWGSLNDVVFTLPYKDGEVTIKTVLISIFVVALVLCAIAMAIHTRRGDRRFLVAMVAPWAISFAFMPQMHSRYLLFAATIGAVVAGVSLGLVLLDLILIAFAWMMTSHLMFAAQRMKGSLLQDYVPEGWADPVKDFILRCHPDAAWAIMLIALVFLYYAITPTRRVVVRPAALPIAEAEPALSDESEMTYGKNPEVGLPN